MAISNYYELKIAVANHLHRVDLTDRIPEFIEGGLQRINNELLLRKGIPDQEQVSYASTVASQESLTVPLDFAMLRWIKLENASDNSVDPLEPMDYDSMIELYGTETGVPQKFDVVDDSFYFRPIPDAVYTVRIGYIKRYSSLSSNADTNYLLTRGGNVLLYASLLEAEAWLDNDGRIPTWAQGYKEGMENLRIAARRMRNHRPRQMSIDAELLAIGGGNSGANIFNG